MYSRVPESPITAFKRSQAKYLKHSYKTTNWPEYEAGLRQRGSLTVWIAEDELKGWGPPRTGQRKPGGQQRYSDRAIETALTVGMVFHLALRQADEGFLQSLFSLLGVDSRAPGHTTIHDGRSGNAGEPSRGLNQNPSG